MAQERRARSWPWVVSCLVSLWAVAVPQARAGSSLSGTYTALPRCSAEGAGRAVTEPAGASTLVLSELGDGAFAAWIDGVAYRAEISGSDGELVRCGALRNGYNDDGSTLPLHVEGEQISVGGAFGRVGSCQATWVRTSAIDPRLRACE
jgi:hypothetical protein